MFVVILAITIKHTELSGYVFYGAWFLSIFFLTSFYECNLRAYLMQVPYEKAVNTEQDLLELGQDMFVPLGTPFKSLFKNSPISSQQELFKRAEAAESYFYFQSGNIPEKVQNELRADRGVVVTSRESAILRFEKSGSKNPFRISKSKIWQFYAGYVAPKNSIWIEDMSDIILHLKEGGILQQLLSLYMPPAELYGESKSFETNPVAFRIEHFTFAFYLAAFGHFVSFVIFLVEKYN